MKKVIFRVPKGYKGYKIFNPDWTCINMHYACPATFNLENKDNLEFGKWGFHFCKYLADCYSYYPEALEDNNYHICEINALGRVTYPDDQVDSARCTDKIEIVKELTKVEIDNTIFQQGLDKHLNLTRRR